jgi:hypothetical protein
MSKKKAKHRKERRQLVEHLVAQFHLSSQRANAIAKRYGPSEGRCAAAAAVLCRLRALLSE